MATTTVPVTVSLGTLIGEPCEGITVRARLDRNEVYGGFVISVPAEAVTDADGVAVLNLFPNAPEPDGLGTQGSTYRFTAAVPGGRSLNVEARVPNQPCRLEDILLAEGDAIPSLDAAQLALAQVQAAATGVTTSAAAAATAAESAGVSASNAAAQAAAASVNAADAVASASSAAVSQASSAASAAAAAASASAAGEVVASAMADLAAPGGSALVWFSQTGPGSVPRSTQDKLRDTFSLQDYGALGGGADDTAAVASAMAAAGQNRIFGQRKQYRVSAINNPLGADFDDAVQIRVGDTLHNTYAHRQMVWGAEHLFGFYEKVIARTPLTILFSGDSTTSGVGAAGAFRPDTLIGTAALQDGFTGISVTNAGHSGQSTDTWDSTYVAADIATNPDVYVIRWGANDPFYGRSLAQFAASLRSGLGKIRAAYPLASRVSIVLMSPNSMSDTPSGRDEYWFEEAQKIVRRAARDYNCAFIDTYGLFQNSRDAAGKWMDDPFSDGRAIHPANTMNLLIGSVLYDLLFPSLARVYFRRPKENVPALQNGWTYYGAGTKEAGYYRDRNARVHISGIIKNGATADGTLLFGMGAGFTPRQQEFFPVVTSAAGVQRIAGVTVTTAGEVKIFGANAGSDYISLSGISFLGS